MLNSKDNLTRPLDWAKESCRALMESYTPEQLPPEGRWHYHQGIFLFGMLRLWEQTKQPEYLAYIKAYVDHLVDAHGNFIFNREELDSIQAGLLLFTLHRETQDKRYKVAAEKLCSLFDTLNRTSEGGFWHKDKYPYQLWLDGLYMGGSFATMYASYFNVPELYDSVAEHERLMRKYTRDETTGLYYHAWDESKQTPWSNKETGKSPEFWGRAMGWYTLALPDFLDELPAEHPARDTFIRVLKDMLEAVVKVQDQATGLWYQVLDKGDQADNWLETSCSCLFIYSLAKSARKGYVDQSYAAFARKGFEGLKQKLYYDEQGHLTMPDICIGTGVGDYQHYVNRPTSQNDLHGVGALVLCCVEMDLLEQ